MGIVTFVLAHEAVLAAVVVAVLDFVIEIHPGLKQDSLISLILAGLHKLLPQPPAPPAA